MRNGVTKKSQPLADQTADIGADRPQSCASGWAEGQLPGLHDTQSGEAPGAPLLSASTCTSRLLQGLRCPDLCVRAKASILLREKRGSKVISALSEALADEDALVRFCSATSLAEIFRAVSIPEGSDYSEEEDPGYRRTFRIIDGRFKTLKMLSQPLGPLLLAFCGTEPSVRKAAAQAINALPIIEQRLTEDDSIRKFGIGRCAGILGRLLDDVSSEIQLASVKLLYLLKMTPRVIDLLTEVLGKNPSCEVRWWAGLALLSCSYLRSSSIKKQKVLPVLIQVLSRDDQPDIRSMAASVLGAGRSKSKPAEDQLIAALQDSSGEVRRSATGALGKMRSRKSTLALVGLLKDDYAEVRCAVARALGKIGDRTLGGRLIPMLKDSDESVRMEVAGALVDLRIKEAVPSLIRCLDRNGKTWAGRPAAEALARLRPPEAVPPLIKLMGDKDENARIGAANALADTRDRRAIPVFLKAMTGDASSPVRAIAARGLYRMDKQKSMGWIRDALRTEKNDFPKLEMRSLLRKASICRTHGS